MASYDEDEDVSCDAGVVSIFHVTCRHLARPLELVLAAARDFLQRREVRAATATACICCAGITWAGVLSNACTTTTLTTCSRLVCIITTATTTTCKPSTFLADYCANKERLIDGWIQWILNHDCVSNVKAHAFNDYPALALE